MTTIWSRMFEEAARAARQAPRIYFAPIVGAVRETARVFREVQRENRLTPHDPTMTNRDSKL